VKVMKVFLKWKGLDRMRWALSYDVFVEVSNPFNVTFQGAHFIYRQEKS
jgi:hypothetical protein